jgi:hypothetical protein
MQQTVNPSLQELRRETEQIRVGLTQTVERLKTPVSETASDLRQRISPEATKRKDRAMSAQGANGLFMMSPPPRVEPHTTSHGGRGKRDWRDTNQRSLRASRSCQKFRPLQLSTFATESAPNGHAD